MHRISFLWLLAIVLLLTSCAEQVPVSFPEDSREYGFFSGIWHGLIAPFALVGMFFDSGTAVYANHNSGFPYALGFLIGSGGWGVLAGRSKRRT
ncbi:MAG: hypothetical protein RLY31_3027 [Bacteroidota bacterium]|jgi:hypothetical protein